MSNSRDENERLVDDFRQRMKRERREAAGGVVDESQKVEDEARVKIDRLADECEQIPLAPSDLEERVARSCSRGEELSVDRRLKVCFRQEVRRADCSAKGQARVAHEFTQGSRTRPSLRSPRSK